MSKIANDRLIEAYTWANPNFLIVNFEGLSHLQVVGKHLIF